VPPAELDRVERMLLLHLLDHHGQQVRFEASQWVTEFGIIRQFPGEPPEVIRRGLHTLEMGRFIYQRTQYVVGYSEPKPVYFLTPSGHRKALEIREATPAGGPPPSVALPVPNEPVPPPRTLEESHSPEPSGSTEPTI